MCEAYNFQNLLHKTPTNFRLRRAMALRAPRRPNTLMTALAAIIKHLILEPLLALQLIQLPHGHFFFGQRLYAITLLYPRALVSC